MNEIQLYSDGACSGNPGKGGWGCLLEYNDNIVKELSKGYRYSTNNRMELLGIIEPLECILKPCTILIYSDSQYIVNSINKRWLTKWKSNNWEKSDGKIISNLDLWKKMDKLCTFHDLIFKWVKGHDNNLNNELCDELAVKARINKPFHIDIWYEKLIKGENNV